ncbi:MAG: sterol desaturase family protein [Planctomycetes bacterium]|nr:sterol desaturase family protein [Planctomycetota bacterium]
MLEYLAALFSAPPTLGILALFAALAALEALAPRRKLPNVPWWHVKGVAALLVGIMISSSAPLLWDEWLSEHRLLDSRALGDLGGAVTGFLLYQFIVYIWHRAMHRFDFLWRWFHQMHHSIERMDVIGALYGHPLDVAGFSLVTSLSLVGILGVTATAAVIASVAVTACSLFQHTNIRTPRALGWVIQRPEAHALHHARGSHAQNYGDIALFDMIFGTYRNPESYEGPTGFWDGASSQIVAMLAGRDVSNSPRPIWSPLSRRMEVVR